MLKSRPGIVYAEALAERDGEAYTYMIESEYGVDIRKNLFFTLAEKGWPLIGMEALGMSLEDIFITVVDKTDTLGRGKDRSRARSYSRGTAERAIAGELVRDADEKRAAATADQTEPDEL